MKSIQRFTLFIISIILFLHASPSTTAEPRTEQEKAIDEIKKLHGEIKYDSSNPDKPIVEGIYLMGNHDSDDQRLEFLKTFTELKYLTIDSLSISDVFMENLSGMKKLEQLALQFNVSVTDKGMEHLKGLTHMKKLQIIGSKEITANGLKYLKDLKDLEYLNLAANKKITDDGMENIEAFQNLNTLVLSATGIRGKGLSYLARLGKLRYLNIASNLSYDDDAIKYLRELKQLEVLDISNTRLPTQGTLGESLSKCNIIYYWGTPSTSKYFKFEGREWLE
jgi:hypothetical protein